MNKSNKICNINGKIDSTKSDINELKLKYKVKGETEDSLCLYSHNNQSTAFCQVISNIFKGINL